MSYTTFRFKAPVLKGLADVQLSEPTPELKEVLKLCSTGQDLILASTQKDHAEKGPFIWTMNELSKTTLGYGTRMLVLCDDESRVKKVVTFLRKLGEQIAFDAEAITADMEAQKVANIIGKAPHAIVGTPTVLKEALETNRALLRDINLLYMMGAHKMDTLEDVKAVFPRVISPKQRVVQLGKKATMALRLEVLTWVRDPHHVGIDPPIEGLEAVVPTTPEQEAPVQNEAPASLIDTPPATDSADASIELPEQKAATSESQQTTQSKEQSSSRQDDTQLLETITPLLKRAMIPNDLPLATVVKRLKESSSQRAVVFCQGPAEADALFKELRAADLGVISVHSKLRRSTYDYRINRFQSGDVNFAIIGGRLKSQEPLKQVSRAIYTLLPRSRDTFLHDMSLVQWSDTPQEALFLVQEKDKESFETFKADSGLDCTPLVLDGLSELKPVELIDRRKEKRSNDRNSSSSKSGQDGKDEKTAKSSQDKRSTKGSRGSNKSLGGQSQGDPSKEGQKGSQNRGKGGSKPQKPKGKGRGQRAPEKPITPYGLPRANFDRLDGGKEGAKTSGGLFGAIKKIFGN
ncbi:MAG: DEAD/DEAH box helicase [Bacteroidetes bacterium]|nr:DEAD/DEAH box helicase [Bacteroidota bacterium]MDA0907291.1 DEAD/DEAH box helicase [Bacteroidota bacterium]